MPVAQRYDGRTEMSICTLKRRASISRLPCKSIAFEIFSQAVVHASQPSSPPPAPPMPRPAPELGRINRAVSATHPPVSPSRRRRTVLLNHLHDILPGVIDHDPLGASPPAGFLDHDRLPLRARPWTVAPPPLPHLHRLADSSPWRPSGRAAAAAAAAAPADVHHLVYFDGGPAAAQIEARVEQPEHKQRAADGAEHDARDHARVRASREVLVGGGNGDDGVLPLEE